MSPLSASAPTIPLGRGRTEAGGRWVESDRGMSMLAMAPTMVVMWRLAPIIDCEAMGRSYDLDSQSYLHVKRAVTNHFAFIFNVKRR